MKRILIIGGAVGIIWYLSKRARADERQPEMQRIGDIEAPADADPNVIAVQDLINVIEYWIMQAAGDVSAGAMGLSLPGPLPDVDFFGSECAYTGRLDPETRLHLTKIKGVVGKTRLEPILFDVLGLRAIHVTDMAVEDDPLVLWDILMPLFEYLPLIGGAGYPAADDLNRGYWALYEAIGNAYWLALGNIAA